MPPATPSRCAGNVAAAVPQRRARGGHAGLRRRRTGGPYGVSLLPGHQRRRRAAVERAGLVSRGGVGAGGGLPAPGDFAPQGPLRPVLAAAGPGTDRRGHVSGPDRAVGPRAGLENLGRHPRHLDHAGHRFRAGGIRGRADVPRPGPTAETQAARRPAACGCPASNGSNGPTAGRSLSRR